MPHSQRLARIATADSGGQPHAVPVGFKVSADGAAFEVGGRNFGQTKKYRDIRANPRVALVIDDLAASLRGSRVASRSGGRRCFGMEEVVPCHQISLGRGSHPSES